VTLPAGSSPTIAAGSVGEGFDTLSVVAAPGDAAAWRAELTPASTISRNGTAVGTFSQFRYFSFDLGASSALTVRGTEGQDRVQGLGAGSVDVDLGGGDDYLAMFDNVTVPSGGAIDLGSGTDRMSVGSRSSLDVDLREGRLGTVGLAGVETTIMAAPVVRYRGSTGADTALAMGCRVTMTGGPGADVLRRATEDEEPSHPSCKNYRFDVRGQGGRDELGGYRDRDRLIGGPGRDTADGRQGVDVCRAEEKEMCER
jgi:Ca2+-binding RTX toxin-like protein